MPTLSKILNLITISIVFFSFRKAVYQRSLILIVCLLPVFLQPAWAQYKGIDSLENRLELTASINDSNKVNLINNISFSYCFVDLKEMTRYANSALVLAQKINYQNGIAGAYKNLGVYYMLKDANPLALDYFDKSYKLYISLNNRIGAAKALNNMGYFYSLIKDYKEGNDYYMQAAIVAKGLFEPQLKATWLGNIGVNFEAMGKLDSAYVYYKQMLALTSIKENRNLQGTAYSNLASYHLKKKNFRLAIQIAEKALYFLKADDNALNQEFASTYMILGKAYYNLGEYQKARQFFEQSNDIAKRVEYSEIIVENYHNFYRLDSLEGNSKAALKNFLIYSQLHDSLTNANKNRKIAFYQIKFQSEKSHAENQRLRKEEEKNKVYMSRQQTRVITLAVAIGLILIAVFILSRVNRRMESKNKIIKQQNKNLEEANLVKNKLFSVIAHDLRTPFSHIIPLLEMIEKDQMDQADFKELAPLIKVNFLDNLLLVDNLLLWAKSQLDGFKLKPEAFNVYKLGEELKQFFREVSYQKNITIQNAIQQDMEILADRETIKIVMRNLISNAIKFTCEGGYITMGSKISKGIATIQIIDTGVGIKNIDPEQLFTITTYTTLGTSNEKGTGMGLKICKDFIELNHGTINVESIESLGTTFSFTLPLAKGEQVADINLAELVQ
jgi:signal transduction histidine kinase